MRKKIKRLLRSNIVTCYTVYILKYKIVLPITYYVEYMLIKLTPRISNSTDILKYKDCARGKACIIVGNGPSAKFDDFDAIQKSGIDSFGANRILDVLDRTTWRPTYLCVMDPAFIIGVNSTCTPQEYYNQIQKYKIHNVFLNSSIKKWFRGFEGLEYIECPLAQMYSSTIMPFSKNASRYVSDMGNVTHFSIQLAYYMGYKTIYLYGTDNTYVKYLDNDGKFKINNSVESHIYGMKTNVDDAKVKVAATSKFQAYRAGGYADKRKNDLGYSRCKKFAENHGLKIINLTHGGALDFFDRQEFDDVFEI